MFSLRTCPPPPISLYIYLCFLVLSKKKRLPDHSFLKLKSGHVNQTHAHYFTCTIVSISIVPWFTEAIEWSLSVITPSVFMTAVICSVALIYVWRINPVNLKVLIGEKINIKTAKVHYLSYKRNSTTKCSSDCWKNIQALQISYNKHSFECFETRCQFALHQ